MKSAEMTRRQLKIDDLVKQKSHVGELLNVPVEGRFWFVLDCQWWTKWCAFVDAAAKGESLEVAYDDFPGEVDNSNLLTPDGKLKPDLLREEDFTLVPEEVWNELVKCYGCVHDDTTVFKRSAVSTPTGKWIVEVYPPHFSFLELNTMKFFFEGIYSESQTIGELKSIVKKRLNLGDSMNIRLFVRDGTTIEELTSDGVTIGEASLERKMKLYVKVEAVDGLKAGHSSAIELVRQNDQSPRSGLSNSLSGNLLYQQQQSGTHYTPGVCGLTNLGNTCFMNSALQCMSNVPELTAYFLSNAWKLEINRSNPLGTHGRLANAYAELIAHMWSGKYSHDVPRSFKREIALVASQFSGCAQHDSHELLVFLLDGLHEDLNRVKNKPYIEVEDAGDRPDEIVARESWTQYKARNDSVIVDCFHGQLKSTVVCPTCNYRSVTFDPFASLNLPLPEVSSYYKAVRVWPWAYSGKISGPLRYDVPVQTVFCVRELLLTLESLRPLTSGCQYYMAEVYNHSMGRPYHPDHQIRDRYGPPVFVYELPPGELLPVRFHRPTSYNASGWVGIPFYVSIPPAMLPTVDQNYLIQAIVSRLRAIGITSIKTDEGNGTFSSPRQHSDTEDSSEDEPERDSLMDNYKDSIARHLVGRIHVTDEFNQESLDMSDGYQIDLSKTDRSFIRIMLDCTNSNLHIELDEMMRGITQSITQVTAPKTSINLSQCIEKFVSTEKLGARDLWYCRQCKEHKPATKKFDLWSLPNILVVQLKRFRATMRLRDKIDTRVDFPIKGLDLTPWVVCDSDERFIYDLIAVTNHMGCLYGGHYTAYALNHPTQRWYCFNDASTCEIDASQIVTTSAYVLVYRRREGTFNQSSGNNSTSLTNGSVLQPGIPKPMYIDDADLDSVE